MISFTKRLDEAVRKVVPLEKIDPRLKADSELLPAKTRLKVARVGSRQKTTRSVPTPVQNPLKRQPQYLSDSFLREDELDQALAALETPKAAPKPAAPKPAAPEGAAQAPAPEAGAGQTSGEAGISSGSKYTLQQAKGQLDGIVKQWMDLAGNLPEGGERHKFLEIGERLRAISGAIQRDFIETGKLN